MLRLKLLPFFSALLAVAAIPASAQTIAAFQTTPDLLEALTQIAYMKFTSHELKAGPAAVITVDDGQQFQTIDGFGASLTGAAAWLFAQKLPPDVTDSTFQMLFDHKRGIGLSFLRQPIGASDLSTSFYSYDDLCVQKLHACTTPAGVSDPGLTHFSLAHDQQSIIPLLQKALAIDPQIRIMLTPWSPPGWMKTSGSMLGLDPATRQPSTLRPEFYQAYANYLVKTIQGYQAAGVPIYAISMENEPLYAPADYPGMYMPAQQQAAFLANALGPALAAAHLDTRVLVYDHNWDHPEYPETVLSDPRAREYAAGVAWHHYAGSPDVMIKLHDEFSKMGEWETESSGGTWQTGPIVPQEAAELVAVMRNWSRSFVLWALATDQDHGPHIGGCGQCRGVVTLDLDDPQNPIVKPEPDFYVLGQASKFVYPGAVRIASTEPPGTDLEDVAFRNPDGTIVLYTVNAGSESQDFRIRFRRKAVTTILPAGTVATFIWKP
ncbi:MAG TPA: glycoside hydrolase family 30 beta sandwich domain-containing protein [Terracidiphilus sp.]|nr:glycoside hydrolase family 30 beta sandwich domain-containing protein [Terracidiphilus sp.]